MADLAKVRNKYGAPRFVLGREVEADEVFEVTPDEAAGLCLPGALWERVDAAPAKKAAAAPTDSAPADAPSA